MFARLSSMNCIRSAGTIIPVPCHTPQPDHSGYNALHYRLGHRTLRQPLDVKDAITSSQVYWEPRPERR